MSTVLLAGPLALSSPAAAAPPEPVGAAAATFVDLGAAASYSVLAGTGVANTGAGTALALDLGLSPTGAITGFPPGTVSGTVHDKDAAAQAAQADRAEAYAAALAQTGGTPFAGDQIGVTFHPGVHTSATAFANTGTMTLDADSDPSAVFVFQVGAAFSPAAASKVVLTDGALANNVFWQVSGAVTIAAGAEYAGTFLGNGAITLADGASLKGRALTPGTVTTTNAPVTQPIDDLTAPVVTLDGGPARSTNDVSPTISGTTDEPVGTPVTVTVAGQTISSSVRAGGAWALGTTPLAAGSHEVVASITDASRNTGTDAQVLTVDVTAPAVSIDGGPTRATHDVTPLISGTTDETVGTAMTVTVGGQTLSATSGAGGVWSVQPTALTESGHLVVASVADVAGNSASATQVLTVDVTTPVVTIDGGAQRSTDDTSPWTYGTTAEKAGTTVEVAIGGQNLTATVAAGGAWGVSAADLPHGSYHVVASVTDAAGNTGTATQTLTITGASGPVGPVDPVVPVTPASPRYRPDAEIRTTKGSFVGAGVYGGTNQRATQLLGRRSAPFEVRITNRGDATEQLSVRGAPSSRKFKVAYLAGGQNVTGAVVDGSYRTRALQPGESTALTVKVTKLKAATPGSKGTFQIRAGSTRADVLDAVAAVVKVARAGRLFG